MIDIAKGRWWDKAWSLVSGCTPVSAACDNCWLAGMEHRFDEIPGTIEVKDGVRLPKFSGNIICHDDRLDIPLRTKKPTVFAIWSDLFHEKVDLSFIDRALEVMVENPRHTFLVLTKRAGRLHILTQYLDFRGYKNIWIGTTVENQQTADGRIHHLSKIPGNKFISCEPLLSEVILPTDALYDFKPKGSLIRNHWLSAIIAGGESGKNARPSHPDWFRSIREQCQAAGVPFFFKQWGEWADFDHSYCVCDDRRYITGKLPQVFVEGKAMNRIGIKKAGRMLDGKFHDDLPWVKK